MAKTKDKTAPRAPTEKVQKAAERRDKARKKRAELTKKAKHTATLLEMKPLASEINALLALADKNEDKALDQRIAAAIKIDEARERCKKEKIPFKAWVEENVKWSYRHCMRLARIAVADDPKLAIMDLRARGAQDVRKHRKRVKAANLEKMPDLRKTPKTTGPAKPPFVQADEMLASFPDEVQMAVAEKRANEMGRLVVSVDDFKQLNERAAKAEKAEPGKLTLSQLEAGFQALSAPDKMKFLEFAARAVGAKLDLSVVGEPDLEVPEHLKRKKGAK